VIERAIVPLLAGSAIRRRYPVKHFGRTVIGLFDEFVEFTPV
jgi:hypothetical protein